GRAQATMLMRRKPRGQNTLICKAISLMNYTICCALSFRLIVLVSLGTRWAVMALYCWALSSQVSLSASPPYRLFALPVNQHGGRPLIPNTLVMINHYGRKQMLHR